MVEFKVWETHCGRVQWNGKQTAEYRRTVPVTVTPFIGSVMSRIQWQLHGETGTAPWAICGTECYKLVFRPYSTCVSPSGKSTRHFLCKAFSTVSLNLVINLVEYIKG
jgi:hypothetical protein